MKKVVLCFEIHQFFSSGTSVTIIEHLDVIFCLKSCNLLAGNQKYIDNTHFLNVSTPLWKKKKNHSKTRGALSLSIPSGYSIPPRFTTIWLSEHVKDPVVLVLLLVLKTVQRPSDSHTKNLITKACPKLCPKSTLVKSD